MDLRQGFPVITSSSNLNHNIITFQMFSCLHGPQSIPEAKNIVSYTQQVVQLLTQQIQRRTSWEHEKLLLFGQYDEQLIVQANKNKQCAELVPENNLQYIEIKAFIKLNPLEQIKTPDLFPCFQSKIADNFSLDEKKSQRSIKNKKVNCNCKKSQCLKMYCECFRNGEICRGCACCDCNNKQSATEQRRRAIKRVEQKQPVAFQKNSQYKGCRCTKSNCQKGYCQCFAQGVMCGKYCECRSCNNCSNYMKSKQKKHQQRLIAHNKL